MFQVTLFYNFSSIENPPKFCADQRRKCMALNLLGRVYVAQEGINGTLSGRTEDINEYKEYLLSLSGFEDTEFKTEECDHNVFADLRVKVRPEIVAMKTPIQHDPKSAGGKFLSPHEWREVLESNKDYVLIDVRNNYETKIGHFEGALCPPLANFYDFPQWVKETNLPKNKKVLMYCTGGIRCEKFSIYMKEQGYEDVNQLHGGIVKYGQEEGGAHFKGKCFVFDDRLVAAVNPEEKEPISQCEITGVPCDHYINCANMDCNKLFICSPEGAEQMQGCCSEECLNNPHRRPFNKEELYIPFRRWYKYFDENDKINKKLKSSLIE